MLVTFNSTNTEFTPWSPSQGRAFNDGYAFDSETTLIDEKHRWITPAYVIGAAFDGSKGVFLTRENVGTFFELHNDLPVCMHNAAFDLRVVDLISNPQINIYDLVDRDQVWDTQILYRLLMLATEGHTATGKGQKSSLEHCVQRYLNCDLPKDVVDCDGNIIRTSYGKFLGKPPSTIPGVYLEYLAKDVMATLAVFHQLNQRINDILLNSQNVWGYVNPAWLNYQHQRWGPLTHHIQIKASIVLDRISENGLRVAADQREELMLELSETLQELRVRLRRFGLLTGGKGSGKSLQKIMQRLDRDFPEINFPRTETGKYATSGEALEELIDVDFVKDYLQYKSIEKVQSTFLQKMCTNRVHPSFGTIQRSGRSSSFGEINAQNLPRDDRIRNCFIPSEGNVFINADYSTVELATLAQSVLRQFGHPSAMAYSINSGTDLHRLVASHVTGKSVDEVTSDDRQKAKPINFGKPGGMGDAGLKRYASNSYGVNLTDGEVTELTNTWFNLFPEMKVFLKQESNAGLEIAKKFNLTPYDHREYTGSDSFAGRCETTSELHAPNLYLGWMFRKALMEIVPRTQQGVAYSPADVNYFWLRANEYKELFPARERTWIESRRPSIQLGKTAQRIADLAPCFTLTGRLRANATFCGRHNTVFQGLAADGAKIALWKLWRAGYHIANFIHDEVLIEVNEDSLLLDVAEDIKRLMIAGMKEVVPDVRIDVEYAASRAWSKSSKRVLDEYGNLIPWTKNQSITQPVMASL